MRSASDLDTARHSAHDATPTPPLDPSMTPHYPLLHVTAPLAPASVKEYAVSGSSGDTTQLTMPLAATAALP